MKTLKSQRGAIDIILIVVVLVLAAGLGGYVYYQQQQNNKALDKAGSGVTVTKKTAQTTTAKSGSYAGWKTYTSAYEKSSFMYPSTWTVAFKASPGVPGKQVILTSPSGLKLTYDDFVDGLGGGCNPEDPHVKIESFEKLSNANGSHSIYLVTIDDGTIGLVGSSDFEAKTGDTGSCLFYFVIDPKNGSKTHHVMFSEEIQSGVNETDSKVTAADSATAKLILKSYKY